ncbi:MAG TPA: DEAD/DEAH box helicase [Labilithrix sp.]
MSPLPPELGPELTAAFEAKGYSTLTPVQEAVLDPALEGRDLRISSQTGSGKTIAIGFVMRESVSDDAESDGKYARPRALVVTPTRELAKQVEAELAWLYRGLEVRVASVTGGGGYRDELRSFKRSPAVIVGTPGRLRDHLERKSIDASNVAVVVLDEADRMLDLGFREDIEQILGKTPAERRTVLVSATFPREVKALADRFQRDAVTVQGTPLGAANTDIEHVIHLVHPKERIPAIVNLLLSSAVTGAPQTLVFARTRADVAELAAALDAEGFSIGMLSGEMDQPERNRALAAFKRGSVAALVATDVAARGIDVVDIARVIHAQPPEDTDAYTHRSGRTGRAGRKGTSSLLVAPGELVRTLRILARAGVQHRFEPVPSATAIRAAQDAQLFAELTEDAGPIPDGRAIALAERLAESSEPTRALARLVARATRGAAQPRELTPVEPPARARGPHPDAQPGHPRAPKNAAGGWVRFRVSWGASHGAGTRRLVAMLCRRGNIQGKDIGAIQVQRTSSVVEIASGVAEPFERVATKPDPRDPRIAIRRWVDEAGGQRTPKRRDRS